MNDAVMNLDAGLPRDGRGAGRRHAARPVRGAGPARHRWRTDRARLPAGRAGVEVLARDGRQPLGRLAPVLPTACSSGRVSSAEPYRLRINWPGAVQETEDPYSLRPAARRARPASVQRRPAFRAGSASRRAGVVTIDGVRGVRFAVWAPNARARLGGRRLQCLGRAAPPDAAALSGRRLGAFHPAPRRRRALQVRDRRPGWLCACR